MRLGPEERQVHRRGDQQVHRAGRVRKGPELVMVNLCTQVISTRVGRSLTITRVGRSSIDLSSIEFRSRKAGEISIA